MIRRNLAVYDRDQRMVKWFLLAAGFALTVGFYAQSSMPRHAGQTGVAEQRIEAAAPAVAEKPAPTTSAAGRATVTG